MEENIKTNESSNDKKVKVTSKKKKVMIIVAVCLILFLSANVFAATQGYNNIFFIIKSLVSNDTEVTDRNVILSDRDITISYQPIEVSEGLEIQINKLVVKENEATLFVQVRETDAIEKLPARFMVYDTTTETEHLLGNHDLTRNFDANGRYTEEIKLYNFKEDTDYLGLEVYNEDDMRMMRLEIKLSDREINIVTNEAKDPENLPKISEVELKEFLSDVLRVRFFEDQDAMAAGITAQEYRDEIKVLYALELLGKESASKEEVHEAILEFTGYIYEEPLDLANIVVQYKDGKYQYIIDSEAHQVWGLCLSTNVYHYEYGIYGVECVYTYPTREAYLNGEIEELDKYFAKVEVSVNDDYKYSKYRIMSVDYYESEKLEENDKDNIVPDKETNTSNTVSTNTVSTNTVTNSTTNVISNTTREEDDTELTIPVKDNEADTIEWRDFYSTGLRGVIPVDWDVTEFDIGYSGPEDDGKLAKSISGTIIGIDGRTNKEVRSNITVNFYMPEFIDVLNSEDYAAVVASRYNMEASWAGYTSPEGMVWKMVVKPNYHREFFCHLEPLAGGTEGIGYVVEVISDNFDNDKLVNIVQKLIMNLKGASF